MIADAPGTSAGLFGMTRLRDRARFPTNTVAADQAKSRTTGNRPSLGSSLSPGKGSVEAALFHVEHYRSPRTYCSATFHVKHCIATLQKRPREYDRTPPSPWRLKTLSVSLS